MAEVHEGRYSDHLPEDLREIVVELERAGVVVREPVWTVGRLDGRRGKDGRDG